mgnify:CR=1 FL=1
MFLPLLELWAATARFFGCRLPLLPRPHSPSTPSTPSNPLRPVQALSMYRDMRAWRQSEGITGLYRDDPAGEQFPEMEALLEVGRNAGGQLRGWGE